MRRKSIAGPLAKSAVFIVVTTLATAVLALSIAGTGVGRTAAYNATFTDVTGLNTGDSVRIAGVRVGQVEHIAVTNRRLARVRFSVVSGRTLPGSVTASIKYLNLVGQRYVELDQGVGAVGASLRPGGTIPVERTAPALNLTQLFNGFQPLFQALSPKDVNQLSGEIIQVLQGEGTTVDDLIATVGSLTSTLAGKDQVIGRVIDNLTTVVETVNSREGRFDQLITTLQQLVHGFAADRKPIGEAIDALSGLTTSTGGLLGLARDPLRRDIRDLGRLSSNLDRDQPLVEGFVRRLPAKMNAIARIASYGSWLNLYLCQATVSGVSWDQDGPEPPGPPPTGIPVTESRCTS
ncbi:MCE family protein [Actinomadura sp. DC4]|uniref:MCE family protein n=1 Tax=Actinomadura sp. DC4 TaxID=3055069 RepID=UPI0025AFD054|nr:MCE family protein [Actinomadura sp. DC4]MDN3357845.1 MCE family protein [Actinomadura sp. DC4]